MKKDVRGENTLRWRAGEALHRVNRDYSPPEKDQLAGHLGALVAFAACTGAWGTAVRVRRNELPDRHRPLDLLLTAAAAFRLCRLLSKGSITSPLRAPFTRYESVAGPAEVNESPRGGLVRSTVGELATCPFCLSVWHEAH